MKKLISIILATVLLLSLIPMSVTAAEQLKNPQNVTISVSESKAITFSLENVYDSYVIQKENAGTASSGVYEIPVYYFFIKEKGAITANKTTNYSVNSIIGEDDDGPIYGGYMTDDFAAGKKITIGSDVATCYTEVYQGDVLWTDYGTKPENGKVIARIYFQPLSEPNIPIYFDSNYKLGSISELIVKDTKPVETMTATKTASKVTVDGVVKSFDAYTINGNNYFKLRDIAYILSGTAKQFEVTWDGTKNAINLVSGNKYTVTGGEMTAATGNATKTAILSTSKIYLDGKEIKLTAYTISGNNYFKLRDLGQTFDFGVEWDGKNNTVAIKSTTGYVTDISI